MNSRFAALLAGSSLLAVASPAFAQDDEDGSEIVVTGTSIRGIAPTGAQVIGLNAQDVQETGAVSTTQVLAQIPQLSVFGSQPAVAGSNNFQLTVNRPSLRNLGSGVASTSATLILMDGHRLPGSGVLQTFPDPDVVPPSVLERVEVVPDGGSSIYGSDAVAGVINFITLSSFDGVRVDYRHGFGDDFDTDDGSLTLGREWDDGSAFIAYAYAHRDPIAGADRSYVQDLDWSTGLPAEFRCADPNWSINTAPGVPPVIVGLGGGPANRCNGIGESDVYSSDERNSVLAGFSQELGAHLDVEVKAWYTRRNVDSNTGPGRGQVNVAAGSPFNQSGSAETARFSFLPVAELQHRSNNTMETWGLAPTVRWDLGHDWQLRVSGTYAESRTSTHNPSVDPAALQTAVNNGQINPYDVADPTRLGAVYSILNATEVRGFGEDRISQVQAVFDGPIFELPAGEVRVAVGAERFTERFDTFASPTDYFPVNGAFITATADRDVAAEFIEFNIPIFGGGVTLPLISRLDLSLSARHDDYSDFGEVTTTRYGFTYEPVDWITMAGHWGDSFQAPGLADLARSGNRVGPRASIPNAILVAPEDRAAVAAAGGLAAYNMIGVQGTDPNLKPQEAEAWNVSLDVTPPILDSNFSFGVTYWSIDYALRIGSALGFITSPTVFRDFASKINHDPTTDPATTAARYDLARAMFPEAADAITAIQANGQPLYSINDFRNTNTGGDRRQGWDVRARYSDDAPFGTWFASFDATHFTQYKISTDIGAAFGPNLVGTDIGAPDWRYTTTLGVTVGEHWLGQLTWFHYDSVDLASPLGGDTASTLDDQTDIDATNTFDLYVQYDVLGTGLTEDLSLNFAVRNLTDEEPPLLRRTNGQAAGFPLANANLGRIFQVGVSARF